MVCWITRGIGVWSWRFGQFVDKSNRSVHASNSLNSFFQVRSRKTLRFRIFQKRSVPLKFWKTNCPVHWTGFLASGWYILEWLSFLLNWDHWKYYELVSRLRSSQNKKPPVDCQRPHPQVPSMSLGQKRQINWSLSAILCATAEWECGEIRTKRNLNTFPIAFTRLFC